MRVSLQLPAISISVDSGSDIAKEAADVVLFKKSLGVADGVIEGRITLVVHRGRFWTCISSILPHRISRLFFAHKHLKFFLPDSKPYFPPPLSVTTFPSQCHSTPVVSRPSLALRSLDRGHQRNQCERRSSTYHLVCTTSLGLIVIFCVIDPSPSFAFNP
jgi:hypothetical protein